MRSINGGRGQIEPTDGKEDRSEPSNEIKKRISQLLETEDRIEEECEDQGNEVHRSVCESRMTIFPDFLYFYIFTGVQFSFTYFLDSYITIQGVDVMWKNLALKITQQSMRAIYTMNA